MTKKQLKDVGNRIKERRAALGYTQDAFSEMVDLSKSSYTKIENAFQQPSLDTVIIIAKKLGLSIDYIIHGAEDKKPTAITDTDVIASLAEHIDSDKLKYASEVLNTLAKIKG